MFGNRQEYVREGVALRLRYTNPQPRLNTPGGGLEAFANEAPQTSPPSARIARSQASPSGPMGSWALR